MTRATMMVDPELKTYASETQGKYIDAVNATGSIRAASRKLGVGFSAVYGAIERVKRNAAARGYSPDHDYTRPVPSTHVAKGVSTYYDAEGKVRAQWVKSSLDDQKLQEARKAALEALAEELPRLPPQRPPSAATTQDLLNLYTITDYHFGMLAWGRETGAPWDLKIAERTLTGCFGHLVSSAPRARTAMVNLQGDFLHQDGFAAVTPTHGHNLDSDGRFSKIVEVAVRTVRWVVKFALARHEVVLLGVFEGNHDPLSVMWLRRMFAAIYENEPRVAVVGGELPYYAHEHGETMLGFHHGHLKENKSLPLFFAAKFSEMWGRTKKRYAHTGHRHHVEEKEHSGMTVFQHTTLAAPDAHSSRMGYVSSRHATAITYHARFGEVARTTVTPEMLEATC